MRRRRPETNAGAPALPGVGPRSNQSGEDTRSRLAPLPRTIVPQFEDLTAGVSAEQLQSVRTQVQPGEQVAIYRNGRSIRVLLVGRDRLWQHAPRLLVGGWQYVGAVEVTEDGERALPVVVS